MMSPRGTRRLAAMTAGSYGELDNSLDRTTAQYPPAPARTPNARASTTATWTIVRPSGRLRVPVTSISAPAAVEAGRASDGPRSVVVAARRHDRTGRGATPRRSH